MPRRRLRIERAAHPLHCSGIDLFGNDADAGPIIIIRSKGEYLASVEASDRERTETVAVEQIAGFFLAPFISEPDCRARLAAPTRSLRKRTLGTHTQSAPARLKSAR